MDILRQAILDKGKVLNGSILKVDSFLNHQIDVSLMKEIGAEFKRRFSDNRVTKVLTVESSGIAPALFTALEFNVNAVFARKRKSLTLNEGLLTAEVFSYTRNELVTVTISRNYLSPDDSVLIIDDFLANGEVCNGLISLIKQVGAEISGVGIVIEKTFQRGRASLDEHGIQIESLARIASLDGRITFVD